MTNLSIPDAPALETRDAVRDPRAASIQRFGLERLTVVWDQRSGAAPVVQVANAEAQRPGTPTIALATARVSGWLLGDAADTLNHNCASTQLAAFAIGDGVPRTWTGRFLAVAIDHESNTVRVATDPFGTIHAYASRCAGKVILSTRFDDAVSELGSIRLDWPAIASFYQFGFFCGSKTWAREVRLVRPGSEECFGLDGQSSRRHFEWPEDVDRTLDLDSAIEIFAATFREVLTEETRDRRTLVPISGGLDSRSTLAAIPREHFAGDRLRCYSYGWGPHSVETRIAGQLAARRGYPLSIFQVPAGLLASRPALDAVHERTQGFSDITQVRQALLIRELSELGDRVIAAHWGDVWLDSSGSSGQVATGDLSTDVPEILKKTTKAGHHWLLEHMLPQEAGFDPAGSTRAMLENEVARLAYIRNTDLRRKAWKTEQWSFRWTLSGLRAYENAAWPRTPFYDRRVTDQLMVMPPALLAQRKLQIEYLKRHAPDLAAVRWQAYDADLYRYRRFNDLQVPRRALGWLKRRLNIGATAPIRNWEVQLLGHRPELEDTLLGPDSPLPEMTSARAISQLLDDFYSNPSGANGRTVSILLTTAVALRHLDSKASVS